MPRRRNWPEIEALKAPMNPPLKSYEGNVFSFAAPSHQEAENAAPDHGG